MLRKTAALLLLAALLPARAHAKDPCFDTHAPTWAPATGVADPAGDVRVYAIQYKQEIRHVETYATFERKMRCLVETHVLPTADADGDRVADLDVPVIVVFNEDAGLATLGTGTRGAPSRAIAAHGPKDPQNLTGAIAAFGALGVTYARPISWYAERYPDTSPQRLILAAATDTFARGFMATFSAIARDYGVYVVSSNNQAEFRETADPAAVAALADPDLAAEYATGALRTVYEGVDTPGSTGVGRAGIDVYNQAWMWAPTDGVTDYARERFEAYNGAPLAPDDPRANVIHNTRKTPLTNIERSFLDLSDDNDLSVANTGPFTLLPADDPDGRIRIAYGISLPAFMWGAPLGEPLPDGFDPCASPSTWMRCLDARGTTLFLQPEANPGMWAEYSAGGMWQALEWMESAWRAVADPTVRSIRYAVTPHMVGNLVDVTFDGQSVIFERCLPLADGGDTCDGNTADQFVGNLYSIPCTAERTERCDPDWLAPHQGAKRETIVMAPWVADECPECLFPIEDRERLAGYARALQPGSGSPAENDYLETAVWADLDFD